MSKQDKLKLCAGCRNNFYNGNNSLGVKECWSLKSARVVKRFKLGWWTKPTEKGAFTQVKTLSCHHETGRNAFFENLPDFVKLEDVNRES